MCTLFWLFQNYMAPNTTRNWEILLMIYFDFLYYLAFKVVQRMGKELDEEGEEKMLGADIEFTTAHMGGDGTSPYHIRLMRSFTVKEFVERVLNEVGEWGTIEIKVPDQRGAAWIKAWARYSHGDIVEESQDFTSYYNNTINHVYGHGGWSNSNFYIEVKT